MPKCIKQQAYTHTHTHTLNLNYNYCENNSLPRNLITFSIFYLLHARMTYTESVVCSKSASLLPIHKYTNRANECRNILSSHRCYHTEYFMPFVSVVWQSQLRLCCIVRPLALLCGSQRMWQKSFSVYKTQLRQTHFLVLHTLQVLISHGFSLSVVVVGFFFLLHRSV